MTVGELYKLLSKEIGEVKQLNQIEHMRIVRKIDELREINGEHGLKIKGLETEQLQCRQHRERHWAMFVALLVFCLTSLVSLGIMLFR